MKRTLLPFLLLLLLASACTDENRTRRILEDQGYTEIKITGYDAWACSDDDTYATGFEAVSPGGKKVKGYVCCGYYKNCTIRLEFGSHASMKRNT